MGINYIQYVQLVCVTWTNRDVTNLPHGRRISCEAKRTFGPTCRVPTSTCIVLRGVNLVNFENRSLELPEQLINSKLISQCTTLQMTSFLELKVVTVTILFRHKIAGEYRMFCNSIENLLLNLQ